MIDLGWDMRLEEAEQIDEFRLIIPSETTRQYVLDTGYVISDFSRAVMICNSNAPLKVRYWLLERLAMSTVDGKLKQEIENFLCRQRDDLAALPSNDGSFVYTTTPRWDSDRQEQRIFAAFEPALDWALNYYKGEPFTLSRELIRNDKSAVWDRASLDIGPDGRVMDFQRVCADKNGVCREENWTFPNAFYDAPNPFDRGDIVWLPCWNQYGVIETPATALREWAMRRNELDYTDVQMRVILIGLPYGRPEWLNGYGHDHISPIDMERYQPEGWETRNGFDGILLSMQQLCRGEGSIDTLRRYSKQHREYREKVEREILRT